MPPWRDHSFSMKCSVELRRRPGAPACGKTQSEPWALVSRSINTMTFADGACEGRSRSEEKAMQGHRRRRETQRSSATSISPKGGGGTASISLSLLLRDAHRHRVVVASRTRRRRARHKRHHIYGTRHLPTGPQAKACGSDRRAMHCPGYSGFLGSPLSDFRKALRSSLARITCPCKSMSLSKRLITSV